MCSMHKGIYKHLVTAIIYLPKKPRNEHPELLVLCISRGIRRGDEAT